MTTPQDTCLSLPETAVRDAVARPADAARTRATPSVRPRIEPAPVRLDGPLLDRHQRPMRDLRISVTDRCNFRCGYCMPREVFGRDHVFLPSRDLLSFEEITRVAGLMVGMGVRKLRLTGGEPLMRRDLESLVAMLAALRMPEGGAPELTLTTNAALLAPRARALREAGLQRISISLDALDEQVFQRMSDTKVSVDTVLAGIEAAVEAGLSPVKVNMVVRKGMNEQEILPLARYCRQHGLVLRLIEYMDVGDSNGWRLDEVLSADDMVARIHAEHPLVPVQQAYRGEVARRWRYQDGGGELGVITSVTQPFCGDCTRARLSPEGRLYLCLFASEGHDVRGLLRSGGTDADLAARIQGIWHDRSDRYSEQRGEQAGPAGRKIEMSYIGG